MSEHIIIPGYKLLSKIGEGGTSTVWRARQESLNRDVAIKILHRQFVTDADEIRAFLREARAIAKLKSPYIVQIFDVGQCEDTIYLVMEYIDGHSVQQWLDSGRPLPQKQALTIALSVAKALHEAWQSEKIIHRDITPEKIILDERGEVKVADLGLAGFVDTHGQLNGGTNGLIAGTPNYMSPEQAAGSDSMNVASDMYSLGAVLYHMLTGRMPFYGRSTQDVLNAQIDEQITNPRELNPKITPSCTQVITRLMMKDPGQRYPGWEPVIADFNRVLAGNLVLLKQTTADDSTIAPRRDKVPPPQAARRSAETAKAAYNSSGASNPNHTGAVVPIWIKLILNTVYTVFLVWLIYSLLWNPSRPAQVLKESSALARPATKQSPLTAPTPPPKPQHSQPPRPPLTTPPLPEPEQGHTPSLPASVPPSPEPIPSPLPDAATETERQQLLDILKNSIVHVAVTSGMEDASTLLEQYRSEPTLTNAQAQLDEIARFLSPANQPHTLIAEQFKKNIGQEAFVNVGNRRVNFRVEAVDAGIIHTMVIPSPPGGSAPFPADLKIETLEPAEKRRWIGEVKSPEAAFCAAILDLSSGNDATALAQSDACGPFADAVRQFAEKRIPPPEE